MFQVNRVKEAKMVKVEHREKGEEMGIFTNLFILMKSYVQLYKEKTK